MKAGLCRTIWGAAVYAGPVEEIDWEGVWNRHWRLTSKGEGVDFWNRQAGQLDDRLAVYRDEGYVGALLCRMEVWRGCTVLDVGCGTGALAIPLARKVKSVTALDWSPAMLQVLQQKAAAAGVDNIVPMARDWLEVRIGDEIEPHDVVVASRSLPMGDLGRALAKLDAAASRRCYLTWTVKDDYEGELADILGADYHPSPPYTIIYNLLYSMGICANIEILETPCGLQFASLDEAVVRVTRGARVSQETDARLRAFLKSRLRRRDGHWCRETPSRWALISWTKRS